MNDIDIKIKDIQMLISNVKMKKNTLYIGTAPFNDINYNYTLGVFHGLQTAIRILNKK
jgi:hypothetical protein